MAENHLRIAAENWVPWVIINEDAKMGTKLWSGAMMEVLRLLSMKLNFTYELIQPPDHSWGGKLPNGSWTGMIGMMVDG